jgi:hypothetical protein
MLWGIAYLGAFIVGALTKKRLTSTMQARRFDSLKTPAGPSISVGFGRCTFSLGFSTVFLGLASLG